MALRVYPAGGNALDVLRRNAQNDGLEWTPPPGGPPTGNAGGDLGGTYPSPTVTQARGLRETGGPMTLVLGAVSDGDRIVRSGSAAVGHGLWGVDADTLAAWRLDEASGATFVNSINPGTHDQTGYGTYAHDYPAPLARGVGFSQSGAGSYLRGGASLKPATVHVSLLVFLRAWRTWGQLLYALRGGPPLPDPGQAIGFHLRDNGKSWGFAAVVGGMTVVLVSPADDRDGIVLGRWTLLEGEVADGVVRARTNGREWGSQAQAGAIDYNGASFQGWSLANVGDGATDSSVDAIISEVRVDQVARSAAWSRAYRRQWVGQP